MGSHDDGPAGVDDGAAPVPWYVGGGRAPSPRWTAPVAAAPTPVAQVPVPRVADAPVPGLPLPAAQAVVPPGSSAPVPLPPTPVHPVASSSPRTLVLAVVGALLGAAVAVVVTWVVLDSRGPDLPTTPVAVEESPPPDQQPAGDTEPAPPPEEETATLPADDASVAEPRDPEADALLELGLLREESLADVVLDGRWVAQVASKSVGITDPLQVAQNGTHTFYATDILAEVGSAFSLAPSSSVLVLQSTDFGKYSVDAEGQAFWVTLVDLGFSSSGDVDAWCASTFAHLTVEQRENTCAPRTLVPSHG